MTLERKTQLKLTHVSQAASRNVLPQIGGQTDIRFLLVIIIIIYILDVLRTNNCWSSILQLLVKKKTKKIQLIALLNL